ncbi:MAG TPA: organomercurial lyase [Nitrososphaerales archaeon]|nr:organomercurial lyase [Nitrososphaerales archaeon]
MHRVVRKGPTSALFDAELGNRLMRIYGLWRRPRNPDDFFRMLKAESAKHSGTKEFLNRVRSEEAVIGRSDEPTKDWIAMGRSEKVYTLCSYDTLMTAILSGGSTIGSVCPHCGMAMKVRIKQGKLANFSPKGMVFFWGTGPEESPGNPMCDHLHLFPDTGHRKEWANSRLGEMGFEFGLPEAVFRLKERF